MIIGYIHVCQKGEWKKSFTMIFDEIKNSGLYDEVNEIRCGILNDNGILINDDILNDPKIKIIHVGYSHEYERPTLLHMRNSVNIDINNNINNIKYFYFHTKGIRWFGTNQEQNVVDWIKLLIYWNIYKWKDAVVKLDTYDTYGCNYYKQDENSNYPCHYSGNYFWVASNYLKLLDISIGNGYNDPEMWLCFKNPNYFNAYSSGLEGMGHYNQTYPETIYKIDNF
jgi:hypothetical protein